MSRSLAGVWCRRLVRVWGIHKVGCSRVGIWFLMVGGSDDFLHAAEWLGHPSKAGAW